MKTASTLLLASALALPAFSHSASEGATRRFALSVAAHEGGGDRERLLYSGADALAFSRTLEELGGLHPGDAELLTDPDSAALAGAFDRLAARIAAAKKAGARAEAIVYYSGHADERGLLLGSERFDYRAFRERMNAVGADVRIAVVDACASGALTRMKGGTPVPAFMVDKSARSEGYAFLTSSSGSEASQESDRLRGSFFTHALNTGLRGAADASRDGRVTLHEAYQFAYHETLDRTVSTRGGPQHAGYEIQLSGSGDVVLTDLRQATSSLVLAEGLHGRLFIRDSLGHLVAELQKPAGREMNLGLAAGRYDMRLQSGASWGAASVRLADGRSAVIASSDFRTVEGDPIVSREGKGDSVTFHHVPVTGEAGFSSSIFYDAQKTDWHGTQLALAATDARANLRGGQLALAFNVTRGDLEGYQAAIGLNTVGGSLHGFQIAQANVVSGNLRGAQLGGLVGITGGRVRGLQGSGILNVASGGLEGWQLAGIFGVSGGETRGMQLAGIFNASADSVCGGQGAGIFNAAGGDLRGGQGAGIFNAAAGDVRGGQGAGIFNAAGGDLTGGQGAGIFNATAGDVKGGQGAGVFNAAGGNVRGGQGAGIFNLAGGDVNGAQGAAIFNAAFGKLRGIQGSAILNLAGGIEGFSVGNTNAPGFQVASIVNIAAGKVNGYQIGLINLSDEYESGVPIGLVNISRKGSFEGEAWVEETGMVFAGLRAGTRWMHSQLAVGAKKIGDEQVIAPTLGVAGEIGLGTSPLYLETGLMYSTLFETREYSLDDADVASNWSRVRLGLGWKALPYLTVVGGLSYNVMYHPHSREPLTGEDYPLFRSVSDHVSMWPGAWLGFRVGR